MRLRFREFRGEKSIDWDTRNPKAHCCKVRERLSIRNSYDGRRALVGPLDMGLKGPLDEILSLQGVPTLH